MKRNTVRIHWFYVIVLVIMTFTFAPGEVRAEDTGQSKLPVPDCTVTYFEDRLEITCSDTEFLRLMTGDAGFEEKIDLLYYNTTDRSVIDSDTNPSIDKSNGAVLTSYRYNFSLSGNTLTIPYNDSIKPTIGEGILYFKPYLWACKYEAGIITVSSAYGLKRVPEYTISFSDETKMTISSSDKDFINSFEAIHVFSGDDGLERATLGASGDYQCFNAETSTDTSLTFDLDDSFSKPVPAQTLVFKLYFDGYLYEVKEVSVIKTALSYEYNFVSADENMVIEANCEEAVSAATSVTIAYFYEGTDGKEWKYISVPEKYLYKEGKNLYVSYNWFYENQVPESTIGYYLFMVYYEKKGSSYSSEEKECQIPSANVIKNPVEISAALTADKDISLTIPVADADYFNGLSLVELSFDGKDRTYWDSSYGPASYINITEDGKVTLLADGLYNTAKRYCTDLSNVSMKIRLFSANGTYSIVELNDLNLNGTFPETLEISQNENGDLIIPCDSIVSRDYSMLYVLEGNHRVSAEYSYSNGAIRVPYAELVYLAQNGRISSGENVNLTLKLMSRGIAADKDALATGSITMSITGLAGWIEYRMYYNGTYPSIGTETPAYFLVPYKDVELNSFLPVGLQAEVRGLYLGDEDGKILKKEAITMLPEGLSGDVYIYVDLENEPLPSSFFETKKAHKTTVTISSTSYTYTGSTIKPTIKVKDETGATVSTANYKVTYSPSTVKNVGKYTAKITFKGEYADCAAVTKTFTVKPKKASILSLTSKTKSLTVKMSTKVSSTGGSTYVINYRLKGSKTWKSTTTTSQSKVIKSLKKGKTYQIRVRAKKIVSGKTYYGSWSTIKTSKKIK